MLRWTSLLAALAASFASLAARAEPVLMISIDGLRPGDVINADTRGFSAPNLKALMREGAYASGVVNVLPTVTYPNHTTLVTGVRPAIHGISNNTTFDPLGKNDGGWYWYSSDIKVPTLWDAVHAKGEGTASIGWPVTVGERNIDWNVPEIWRAWTPDDLKLINAVSTPGLVAELEQAAGVPLAAVASEEADGDVARAKLAAALIRLKHPEFMTLHLISLDHFEHKEGPGSDKAKAVLATIDKAVGDLIAEARKAEPGLVVVVVSDHGFAPVSTDTNLLIPFIEAGLVAYDPDKGRITGWDAIPWGAGGSAAIVLARPDDRKLQKKVAALLKKLAADPSTGIDQVIDRKQIEKRGAAKEASFWVGFKPGFDMGYRKDGPLETPSNVKGNHGFFPDRPEMRASFFAAGPGVPAGKDLGEIDMRDIAPTVARIMGVDFPSAKGTPLF